MKAPFIKWIKILGADEPVMEAHRLLLGAKRPEDMRVRVTITTPTRQTIVTARRADIPDGDPHRLDGVMEIALHWRAPDGTTYASRAAMMKNIKGRTIEATGFHVAVLADGTAVPLESLEIAEHNADKKAELRAQRPAELAERAEASQVAQKKTTPRKRKTGQRGRPRRNTQKELDRVEVSIRAHGGNLMEAARTLGMPVNEVRRMHDAYRKRQSRLDSALPTRT